ncbi:MAG: hypothetical protein K8R57_02690 [Verrucomicrobia bacterium]|nr:hypothetical protein [Verrucomicrobiota bacterium]
MSATPDHSTSASEPVPAAEDAATAEHVVPEVPETTHHSVHPASAVDLHVAPSEPHPLKRNLWQRWMAWSGSFFVLSLLVHVLLIGGATVLVVQVVAGRKEKLKFTAPPPSSAGPKTVEHKVKLSKATASAPSVSKRITSTAANASIALPAMEMSSSSGPDVMASVMSGLGSGSLGVGAPAGGAAGGGASMPGGGLTAFGYKGAVNVPGLKVNLYDLKQTPNGTKTDIGEDFDKGATAEALCDYKIIRDVIAFMESKWDPKLLEKKYYKAKDTITAYQFWIPQALTQTEVLKAFGADTSVKPGFFIVHYTGKVTAPRDGEFVFVQTGGGNYFYAMRFDEKNIFINAPTQNVKNLISVGQTILPIKVTAGRTYSIDLLVMFKAARGEYRQFLQIVQKTPAKTYPPDPVMGIQRPIFQVKSGLPFPEFVKVEPKDPLNARNWRIVNPKGPKVEEAIVFPAQK